jgi:hypothetical protein
MMARGTLVSPWTSVAVLAGVLGKGVMAHDHHGDNIPEGETISLEPIVGFLCSRGLAYRGGLTTL